MTIISSQRFRDYSIIEEKTEYLQENGITQITVPVCKAFYADLEGNDLYIMIDNHHTYEAAKELGIKVEFEVVDNPYTNSENGEDVLRECRIDSAWYYIQADDEDLIGCDVW